jgi:hypothetical protein
MEGQLKKNGLCIESQFYRVTSKVSTDQFAETTQSSAVAKGISTE